MNDNQILKFLARPGARIESYPDRPDGLHRLVIRSDDVPFAQLMRLHGRGYLQHPQLAEGIDDPNAFVASDMVDRQPVERKKGCYVGAPAIFALEAACQQLNAAYSHCDHAHVYLVGSALERPDWRDVDLRMIMSDADFKREFPHARLDSGAAWEFDPKWIMLTTSISRYLTKQTKLPVDFQFQPMTFANEHHRGPRSAMGMRMQAPTSDASEDQP